MCPVFDDVNNCDFVDVHFILVLLSGLPDCRQDSQADALQENDPMGLTHIWTVEAELKKCKCVTKCRHVQHH